MRRWSKRSRKCEQGVSGRIGRGIGEPPRPTRRSRRERHPTSFSTTSSTFSESIPRKLTRRRSRSASAVRRCSFSGRERFLPTLDNSKRKILVESASKIGRKWLPTYHTISHSVSPILRAIWLTQTDSRRPKSNSCRLCGSLADFGHDEGCKWHKDMHTTARHDRTVLAIARGLFTLDGRVDIVSHSYKARRRNDIRVHTVVSNARMTREYDVIVYSSMEHHAQPHNYASADGLDRIRPLCGTIAEIPRERRTSRRTATELGNRRIAVGLFLVV